MEPEKPRSIHALTAARTGTLLDAYLKADYRWELDGEWKAVHIGQPAPQIDATFPEATRFALLSAWDPHSEPRSEAVNRQADAALRSQLAATAYRIRAAFSSAPDRSWREPSWLVFGMPEPVLDDLSRRFGQLGTLYWRRGERVRLRMDARAPAGVVPLDYVDWLK